MKIAVIGSINIDQVIVVDSIPKIGETIIANDYQKLLGGKGCNQAVALSKLGAAVTFFGAVGKNNQGREIIDRIGSFGINTDYITQIDNEQTGTAFVTVGKEDNSIIILPGANNHVTVDYIKQYDSEIRDFDYLVLQNEIPIPTIEYIISTYGKTVKIIYNPAPFRVINRDLYTQCEYVIVNETEHAELMKYTTIMKEKLIITQGNEGVLIHKKDKAYTIDALPVHPVDTTGAGDTFVAAFTYALASSLNVVEAALFANVAAGISTEGMGAQSNMPTKEQVEHRVHERTKNESKRIV